MVSNESTKNLILEAKGNILVMMQDVTYPDTEWAEEMWHAWDHLNFALMRLEKADNPPVQIDTDRALGNGYPVVCPFTEDE